jgi:anti-sigma regulatory factor (Ser/Thr protein kinase)
MKACIAALAARRKRGDLRPEQEQAIDFAILRLKQLSRLKKASNSDVYNCVAEISEKLTNAFCKSNVIF